MDSLAAAETAGLVRPEPGSVDRFTFVHSLIRQTVLEELPSLRRTRLHLRVAEALDEAHPTPDEDTGLLIATHYLDAAPLGGLARAVDLLHETSFVANAAGRHRLATRALAAADELGLDDRRSAIVHMTLASTAWMVHNDREATMRSFTAAVRFAESVDDPELFAEAVASSAFASGFGLSMEFLELAPRALAAIDHRSAVAIRLRAVLLFSHSWFAPPGVDPAAEHAALITDSRNAGVANEFEMSGLALHSSPDVASVREIWHARRPTAMNCLGGFWTVVRSDLDESLRLLDEWADGPGTIPRDWMYTATLSLLAELAARLGLPDEANELEPFLAPVEGQFVLEACIHLRGSFGWLLGGLAACRGDVDEALRRYERAAHFESAQGALPMAIRTRAASDALSSSIA